jgi:NAD(P)-dependent dehydrogenase (short-subunit alcohol dehydrogenase family)
VTASAAPADLRDRVVVVTGATPGSLGGATAAILASWGARVIVTTRSDPSGAVAVAKAADGHPLDLADAASVSRFADWLSGRHDRIDVLVNNAGIHLDLRSRWPAPRLTADGHELHWRTNYLGTAQLTSVLLPMLARSADARVVNVASKLHSRATNADLFAPHDPYDSWVAYGTSKLALIHHAFELQRRCAASGVQGYALHPGSVYTHIADRGLEGHRILGALRRVLSPVERRVLLSPEQGAQTSVHCASAPGLDGGRYFRACAPSAASAESADAAVSARLWDATADWLAALRA